MKPYNPSPLNSQRPERPTPNPPIKSNDAGVRFLTVCEKTGTIQGDSMTANSIIDLIQLIRSRNNKNWMDMLKLAYKHAPKEASKIMQSITECDAEINKLSRQLGELK